MNHLMQILSSCLKFEYSRKIIMKIFTFFAVFTIAMSGRVRVENKNRPKFKLPPGLRQPQIEPPQNPNDIEKVYMLK